MLASKALWGFWWLPPSSRLADQPIPDAIASFEDAGLPGNPVRWSDAEASKNDFVRAGLESCSSKISDFAKCTFSRILMQNGERLDWLSVKSLELADRERQLDLGLRCFRKMGVANEAPYFGVLGRVRTPDNVHWAFISAETTRKDARRFSGEQRHLECAWPEVASEDSVVWNTYRYDVAGIEFLTPFFMACCCSVLTLSLFGFIAALRSSPS